MGRRRTKAAPDEVWREFAQRHAGHPFLQLDPLYALAEPVIDALSEGVPGLFTGDQEWFERDLARTTRQGFFLRRVIGGADSLPARGPEQMSHFDHRPRRISQPGFGEHLRAVAPGGPAADAGAVRRGRGEVRDHAGGGRGLRGGVLLRPRPAPRRGLHPS